MTKNYETLTNDIRNIEKTLSLWDKSSQISSVTRLSQALKDNLYMRKEMIDLLESYTGKDLKGQLAGQALSPLVSKWLAWVWVWVWWALTFFNPAMWPSIAWTLLVSSPRVIWEIANAIGKPLNWVKSKLETIKNIPNTLKNGNIHNPSSPSNMGEWIPKLAWPKIPTNINK